MDLHYKDFDNLGFDERCISLKYSCINRVEFSLPLNGRILESIKQKRGLRQGDLLSLILFILGSETLSRLLAKEEVVGNLHGIKVVRNAPAITHLMNADNLLVMSRARLIEVEVYQKCFDTYCSWSGQMVNWKNQTFFSLSTHGGKPKKR